eukprot:12736399-Alexandrium_andersonii.AAC.1
MEACLCSTPLGPTRQAIVLPCHTQPIQQLAKGLHIVAREALAALLPPDRLLLQPPTVLQHCAHARCQVGRSNLNALILACPRM